jgi:hypothetical protein
MRSFARAAFVLAALLLPAAPRPAAAQQPLDSLRQALDSLAARLERAEDELREVRRAARDAGAAVRSRGGLQVEVSGLILMNGFANDRKVQNTDDPTFVASPQDAGLPNAHLAAQVRQTRLGLAVTGASALGAAVSADLQLDFYGGQQPSTGGRTFPVPRIRTAVVRLDWRHAELLIGQETQLISPWNPVSFAAVGVPLFTTAGNLWFWVPQVRVAWRTGGSPRVGGEAAALAPMLGSPQLAFVTQADSAERSRRPMAQGRLSLAWGSGATAGEVGVGIHRGWIAASGDSLLESRALTADARIPLGTRVLVQGEAFWDAQAVAGLGGGGVGQEFGAGGVPVRSRGGWMQLDVRPVPAWSVGVGAGLDDPRDADVSAGGRHRNLVSGAHLHWRPGGGLLFGVEARRLRTRYASGALSATHVNGFAGLAF